MKRFFFAATLVLVVMTLAVGVADMQLGRAQVRLNLQAGEGGGPIPTCRPGTNCGPDDTLRQMAGEGGGPIPTCRPGTNCGPDDTLRQIAGHIVRTQIDSAYFFGESQERLAGLS